MSPESLSDGVLSDQVVLDRHFDAATAAASTIFLYFQPDTSGLGGTITDVLSGDTSWVPVLLVDRDTETGTAFHAGGRGEDVFGTATGAPDLASLRLEVTTSGTGDPARDRGADPARPGPRGAAGSGPHRRGAVEAPARG